ncbi:pimeloyl-ACP methyl ester carboxylesterase [Lipingzhangella halophila]|uniref:Pimeloyl-ACP methyl ester carboxylesterase n=1 Tax=Lipingzhangella halophila TaxID=1783352 RepID=A0A7W7RGX7_9ACTN|nr:alpha/beta hydrolase [Lipingzhangella halophila]MBB4931672.1 pimeloyl-ACP methyl ester carboxylesterase [Lipingzhangella halophila]
MNDWHLEKTYRSASGEVRWDRFGDPDGEPVVLLHGTPFSSFVWRGPARALAPHYRVYVWDMPGFGSAEKSADQDISLAALGGVFAELLDHWGLGEPLVVAHDIGGAVALGAHLVHGARYRRLALVDVVALTPWGSPFYRLVDENAGVFTQLPPKLHEALVREYVSSASSPGLHPATLERLVEPWLSGEGQAAFYRQISGYPEGRRHTDELRERYGTITIPVLVCWGEDDTWIPLERGRELASRIPGARLRIIPGAGHLVQEDRPAELTAALLDFLGGVG